MTKPAKIISEMFNRLIHPQIYYLEFDATKYLPEDWREQCEKIANDKENFAVRKNYADTPGLIKERRHLRFNSKTGFSFKRPPSMGTRVEGTKVHENLRWLSDLVSGPFLDYIRDNWQPPQTMKQVLFNEEAKRGDQSILAADGITHRSKLNYQEQPGDRFPRHLDSQSKAGVFCIIPPEAGEADFVLTDRLGRKTRIKMKPGHVYYFNGKKYRHYAEEVKTGKRMVLAFNLYFPDEEKKRPKSLSDFREKTGHPEKLRAAGLM